MVALATQAEAAFTGMVRERVDHAFVRQSVQRSVDGRQANPVSVGAQSSVQLESGDVGRLSRELFEYADALPGRLQPACPEPALDVFLTQLTSYLHST